VKLPISGDARAVKASGVGKGGLSPKDSGSAPLQQKSVMLAKATDQAGPAPPPEGMTFATEASLPPRELPSEGDKPEPPTTFEAQPKGKGKGPGPPPPKCAVLAKPLSASPPEPPFIPEGAQLTSKAKSPGPPPPKGAASPPPLEAAAPGLPASSSVEQMAAGGKRPGPPSPKPAASSAPRDAAPPELPAPGNHEQPAAAEALADVAHVVQPPSPPECTETPKAVSAQQLEPCMQVVATPALDTSASSAPQADGPIARTLTEDKAENTYKKEDVRPATEGTEQRVTEEAARKAKEEADRRVQQRAQQRPSEEKDKGRGGGWFGGLFGGTSSSSQKDKAKAQMSVDEWLK